MPKGTPLRSTADAQRPRITRAAVHVFARKGFHATPVADVAAEAGVSTAYVFRLFGDKTGLFVSAVADTYGRVAEAMEGAGSAEGLGGSDERLSAMTDAYIALIADRDLIAMQSHAQSACSVPEIRDAVQAGIAAVVDAVSTVSGAAQDAVQRFLAYGQLCHLVVQVDLSEVRASWAQTVTAGIRHTV